MKLNPSQNCGCGCGGGLVTYCTCSSPTAPTTLHGTHSVLGAFTVAYDAVSHSWKGTSTYDYPGCDTCQPLSPCPAATVTLSWVVFATCGVQVSWQTDAGGCPNDSGPITASLSWPSDQFFSGSDCEDDSTCTPFALSFSNCGTIQRSSSADILLCPAGCSTPGPLIDISDETLVITP